VFKIKLNKNEKKSVLLILFLILSGCTNPDEKILKSSNYIFCVEVDEANSKTQKFESNEALEKPKGNYISIMTPPLNFEGSIYRTKTTKRRFDFFCSPLSEWSFDKVRLFRPYKGFNEYGVSFERNEYRLRRIFHHELDGADLLITSTWFLTLKMPQANAENLNIVNSDTFSEQVHRLRNLEQATFCLQNRIVINSAQTEICSGVIQEFNSNYSEKRKELLEDAEIMQSQSGRD
jgi:hypothetical protein